jgi:UDP-N-acetyl-D-galactosamine dehydrogenase
MNLPKLGRVAMSSALRKVSVVGLGYVGLPVAVAFGRQARTVGFDID